MTKLEGLRAGVADMRSVAMRLLDWAEDLERSFQAPEAPEQEVPAAAQVQPGKRKKAEKGPVSPGSGEAAAGKAEKGQAMTLPEVRKILAEKCAEGFGTQVKALIESYGASSLKGVPAERYGELLEAAAGLCAETGGDADAG